MIVYYMLIDGVYTRLKATHAYEAMDECDNLTHSNNITIYCNDTRIATKKSGEWVFIV